MLALNTRKLSTTFFISLAIFIAISTVAEASHDSPLQQRDHVNLKRIVRKRSPQTASDIGQVIGAAPIPGTTSTTASDTATPSTTPAASSSILPSSASVAASSSAASTPVSESASGSSSVSHSVTASSTAASSSVTSSSTTQPAAATTPAPATNTAAGGGTTSAQVKSTKTLIKSVDAAATSAPSMTGGAAKTQSNVVTILVAIAASLGGLAILWTVFRKWKLGSSKRFEERLQPIDWRNPSSTPHHDDDGIVPAHRRNSGSSFHSSSLGHSPAPRNNGGLSPLPDHDFTATSGVSPVGGYADMARGPSPQPFMRENRGYEFGVPLHASGGRY